MRMLLSTFTGLALVVLPSVLAQPAVAKPAFTLEDYFTGKTVAKGVFVSKIAKTRREFDVFLTGKWDGKTLKLREDFVYADGEKDRKTWIFTKIEEGRYKGTREDVIGETLVTIEGSIARFEYDVLLPRKGKKPLKVHFKDQMILKPDGIIENRARVSKFGLGVGRVAVDFTRGTNIKKLEIPELQSL